MSKYKLKFMFDWCSGVCVWCANDAAEKLYKTHTIKCEDLNISKALSDNLKKLIELHEHALNWKSPGECLLWNKKQISDFNYAAKKAYDDLCAELGSNFEIEFIKPF